MAETPPAQIRDAPRTPPTPRHGGAYDNLNSSPRRSVRISQRQKNQPIHQTLDILSPARSRRPLSTPNSSRRSSRDQRSNNLTSEDSPRQKSRRIQVFSPSSPDNLVSPPLAKQLNSSRLLFVSDNTTMNEGMLPTPVKTPKKKQVFKIGVAGRALFQEQPAVADIAMPSPRRNRKGKKYNGFSLESFREDGEENAKPIAIFTDSIDRIPKADESEANPFIDHPKPVRSSKRRRVDTDRKKDDQVDEAIRRDEGMVYVFRGKKVYRRFDDNDDDEEEIDATDLGLLEYSRGGPSVSKTLKTLTRKSIRPTRLFQTEEQKRAREHDHDEEIVTEVEDNDEPRSSSKANGVDTIDPVGADGPILKVGTSRPSKSSPFDGWRRMKKGTNPDVEEKVAKGRKRAAPESVSESESRGKRVKSGSLTAD